jgi:spore coat polysaccharide biosynthesis predicted glycosyltransferase SpsG
LFALCVESSHARGMGHLFRAMNVAAALTQRGEIVRFLVNDHRPSLDVLSERGFAADVVSLASTNEPWEARVIDDLGVTVWVNDRLNTDAAHVLRLKIHNIRVATFDDRGDGAALSDLNIAGLSFAPDPALRGARVLSGTDFLVLSPSIATYQRERTEITRILVTMGGADTHGVAFKLSPILREMGMPVTIVLGPSFIGDARLLESPNTEIRRSVPSLIEEMARHDLAITGGGVTPFEANAAGLPCIVVANELFEVPVGQALEAMGGSRFAGHHMAIDATVFAENLPIRDMSQAGMRNIGLGGLKRVTDVLLELRG